MLKAPPAIRFEEVMIDYEGHAIGPFSFVVPAGQVIAIVGATGIGKSSLLHALLGLAPIGSGRILIDGAPLPDPGLRGAVSWAGQSVALLPESIAANLRVARPDADDVALHRAVALAGLEAVIAGRAGGMESVLDPSGSGLSGGERRRIGLARACLRDAPLWLLDEPTADLDSAMALDLIGRVLAATKGRTVLLVTHDDRIAALAHQRITLA
jgi:ATP-binding cassette subfamily C protein CydD